MSSTASDDSGTNLDAGEEYTVNEWQVTRRPCVLCLCLLSPRPPAPLPLLLLLTPLDVPAALCLRLLSRVVPPPPLCPPLLLLPLLAPLDESASLRLHLLSLVAPPPSAAAGCSPRCPVSPPPCRCSNLPPAVSAASPQLHGADRSIPAVCPQRPDLGTCSSLGGCVGWAASTA